MEDLISKRELLERYGVSYGALYRWKRMGLIPEDWFLRRATPTGQETFFHRAQICPRVEQILQRGDTSLEDLAEKLREPERQAPDNWLIVTDRFTSRKRRGARKRQPARGRRPAVRHPAVLRLRKDRGRAFLCR